MAENRINANDIIDVADIKDRLEEIKSGLIGLASEIKGSLGKEKIRLSEIIDPSGLENATKTFALLNDALKKTKEAYEENEKALQSFNKTQIDNAKIEQEMAKARSLNAKAQMDEAKLATEQEKQATQQAKTATEVAKANAEALKAQADAQAKLDTATAKAATEQAKQAAIQERAARQKQKAAQVESETLNKIRAELEQNNKVSNATLESIDLQTTSYRELAAIAGVLGDALKNMTAEQKANGGEAEAMVRVTKRINEELMRQDAAVARYSRNVGNYRSAFDGLGYSIQQIIREVPSAINVSQFFLAISNNIPMVVDELGKFRKEQSDIAEQLETMTEGTEEYIKLQGKQMSLGKKLLGAIFSWQTAIIAILFVLRKYGADFINWFTGLFKKADINGYLIGTREALGIMNREMSIGFSRATAELSLVVDRLGKVNKGTDEWVAGIKKVNEITNSNLNATTATIGEVGKVTEAYKKQAMQIAKNNAIISIMEQSNESLMRRNLANNATSNTQYAQILGLKKGDDDYDEAMRLWSAVYGKNTAKSSQKSIAATIKNLENEINAGGESYTATQIISKQQTLASLRKTYEELGEDITKAEKRLINFTNEKLAGVIDKKALNRLLADFENVFDDKNSGGKKTKTTSLQEMNDRFYQAWEARIQMMQDGEEKERELARMNDDKRITETEETYDKLEDVLKENLKNGLISQKEYKERLSLLRKEQSDEQKANEKKYQEELLAIFNKYQEQRNKDWYENEKEREENEIKAIADTAKREQSALKRRVKTFKDEDIRNKQVIDNINEYKKALIDLYKVEITTTEGKKRQTEEAEKLREAIKKLQAQIDHSKRLENYSGLGDMLNKKGVFDTSMGNKRSILESILGKDAYSVFDGDDEALQNAIEADYEKWLESTQNAIKTWYDTTVGYIGGLIDAFVQLSEAKAQAAERDTENAKEAYEKEKALMEAGYASRIDAAWKEYKEKQEIEKKAQADAQKAQQVQMALDTATQASSMITAIANLYKTMSAGGAIGVAAATVLSGAMIAAFTASKITAAQAARAKYGEGGFEMVEQGGSHASGNDTAIGVRNRNGKEMVVERGEGLGVFSTIGIRRYGRNKAEMLVSAFNNGSLETALSDIDSNRRIGMQINTYRPSVSLKRVEGGIAQLVEQGKTNTYVDGNGNVVVKNGNSTKIYLKS